MQLNAMIYLFHYGGPLYHYMQSTFHGLQSRSILVKAGEKCVDLRCNWSDDDEDEGTCLLSGVVDFKRVHYLFSAMFEVALSISNELDSKCTVESSGEMLRMHDCATTTEIQMIKSFFASQFMALLSVESLQLTENNCFIYIQHQCPKVNTEKFVQIRSSIETQYGVSDLTVHSVFYNVVAPKTSNDFWWSSFVFTRLLLRTEEANLMKEYFGFDDEADKISNTSTKISSNACKSDDNVYLENSEESDHDPLKQHLPGCLFPDLPYGPFSTCCNNNSKEHETRQAPSFPIAAQHFPGCPFQESILGPFSTCCIRNKNENTNNNE